MPAAHRRYASWTPARIQSFAEQVGPGTAALVEAVMQAKPHPEQGFRACLGILRLAKTYGNLRLEAACLRGLTIAARTYGSIASILCHGLDRAFQEGGNRGGAVAPREHPPPGLLPFKGEPMLAYPTQERLLALGPTGMARALEDQRRSPDSAVLSFEERLALLLDRETIERENKRLVARLRFAALRQEAVVKDIDLRAARDLDRALFQRLAAGDWISRKQNLLIIGPRPASASRGWPARSATRRAVTIARSPTTGCRGCLRRWRSRAATAVMGGCSRPSAGRSSRSSTIEVWHPSRASNDTTCSRSWMTVMAAARRSSPSASAHVQRRHLLSHVVRHQVVPQRIAQRRLEGG